MLYVLGQMRGGPQRHLPFKGAWHHIQNGRNEIHFFGRIFTSNLSLWYGISGTALNWFLSYLTGRHQTIKIANCFSAALPTSCGVPQGSVLGLLLFTLYTTPLSSVIQNHNLDHHLYADDTHIYISLATSDTNRSLNQLSDCLQDIFLWMTDSKLKLNADKTVTNCHTSSLSEEFGSHF